MSSPDPSRPPEGPEIEAGEDPRGEPETSPGGPDASPGAPEPDLELHVRGAVAAPPDEVWAALFEPEAMATWLHPGKVPFGVRDEGSIQVVEPRRHVRLTWRPDGWPGPSTLHVRVRTRAAETVVEFRQERIPGEDAREARRVVLIRALDRVRKRVGTS